MEFWGVSNVSFKFEVIWTKIGHNIRLQDIDFSETACISIYVWGLGVGVAILETIELCVNKWALACLQMLTTNYSFTNYI